MIKENIYLLDYLNNLNHIKSLLHLYLQNKIVLLYYDTKIKINADNIITIKKQSTPI